MTPSLTIGIIAKNEAAFLPKLFASLQGVADKVMLVDTGSTDRTMDIAREWGCVVARYTGSSMQADGDWKLQNFSAARNVAIDLAERVFKTDWFAWFDADDVLMTPAALRRALYLQCFDVQGCWIVQGHMRWIHHRLWRTGLGIKFAGRCHEYPVLPDGMRIGQLDYVHIHHDAAPSGGETSNARNLRILMAEWAEDGQTARTAFYIANTYRDAGNHADAAEWYRKRIDFGAGFQDEWLFSHLYLSRQLEALERYDEAIAVCKAGLAVAPGWAEFRMQWAHVEYKRKNYAECIAIAIDAMDTDATPTVLWREESQYRDQGPRLVSWCHEHLGNLRQSLVWAEAAQNRIGGPDPDWEARIASLRQRTRGAKVSALKRPVIALHRPGAIGDILMTLNLIPALKEANPGNQIWYFCDGRLGQPDQLGTIMMQAGCDQVLDCKSWEQWSPSCERAINLVGYPLHEGYPEKRMAKHLLEYFADEMGVGKNDTGSLGSIGGVKRMWIDNAQQWPALPSLTLPRPQRHHSLLEPYCTIQVNAGWSAWKMWPIEKWDAVIAALPHIHFVAIGGSGDPAPLGSYGQFVDAPSLETSIGLIANAAMHVGIDSFGQHLTNYFWEESGSGRRTPAVVLWGSTQSSAAGYPSNVNISHQPPCGPCFREDARISRMPRGICITPERAPGGGDRSYGDELHQCMRNISVHETTEAIDALWKKALDGRSRRDWSAEASQSLGADVVSG